MTALDRTAYALRAAEDAFTPVARELSNARAAFAKSRSQKNAARFSEASKAFDAALVEIEALRAAAEAAEIAEAKATEAAAKAADDLAQPGFDF